MQIFVHETSVEKACNQARKKYMNRSDGEGGKEEGDYIKIGGREDLRVFFSRKEKFGH